MGKEELQGEQHQNDLWYLRVWCGDQRRLPGKWASKQEGNPQARALMGKEELHGELSQ